MGYFDFFYGARVDALSSSSGGPGGGGSGGKSGSLAVVGAASPTAAVAPSVYGLNKRIDRLYSTFSGSVDGVGSRIDAFYVFTGSLGSAAVGAYVLMVNSVNKLSTKIDLESLKQSAKLDNEAADGVRNGDATAKVAADVVRNGEATAKVATDLAKVVADVAVFMARNLKLSSRIR